MMQRMRRRIRRGTHSFDFAHDGIEALEKLNDNPDIDMVITDINMPRMDGLTLLDQIPNVSEIDVRCIVVSAYGDMKNIRYGDEPRSVRFRHQADRLRGPAGHHGAGVGPSRGVASGTVVAGRPGRPAKRAQGCEQHAAVDSAEDISQEFRISSLCPHGACAERWRRLLRRDSLGKSQGWSGDCGCVPTRACPLPCS